MNRGELRTELFARGFDYLSNNRGNQFINRAYRELCEEEDWPFLEASVTENPPVVIPDLRTIALVIERDTQTKLTPIDRRLLTDISPKLTTVGIPRYYYISDGTTVEIFPTDADASVSVRYWKEPATLTNDNLSPVVPARFHQVIVDGAVIFAYLDSDNFEAAREMRVELELSKTRMRDSLLSQQHDRPDDYIVGVVDHQDGW